jgi:hypothetical protein
MPLIRPRASSGQSSSAVAAALPYKPPMAIPNKARQARNWPYVLQKPVPYISNVSTVPPTRHSRRQPKDRRQRSWNLTPTCGVKNQSLERHPGRHVESSKFISRKFSSRLENSTYQLQHYEEDVVENKWPFATVSVSCNTKNNRANGSKHQHESDAPSDFGLGLFERRDKVGDGQRNREKVKRIPGLKCSHDGSDRVSR